jgi:uncharacterized protein (DUF885 family)
MVFLSSSARICTGQLNQDCLRPDSAPPGANRATQKFYAFLASEWEYSLQNHPRGASQMGDLRWNSSWEDISLSAICQEHERRLERLRALQAIPRRHLSPTDQVHYEVMEYLLRQSLEEDGYRFYLLPVNYRSGIQNLHQFSHSLRFTTNKDYEDWIGRMRKVPTLVDQTIALMQEGMREKILYPRSVMQRVLPQIALHITYDEKASPFYRPFNAFPPTIPPAERQRLREAAKEAIRTHVVPAYRKFQQFFRDVYLPACPEGTGLWRLPDGEKRYAFLVRKHTTTLLSPKEIHEIGLREVQRIRAEMEKIKRQVAYQGTLEDFIHHLHNHSRLHFQTGEELLSAYWATAKWIDRKLLLLFRTLPRATYLLQPIQGDAGPEEPFYICTSDRGRYVGHVCVSVDSPEKQPKWWVVTTLLHEGMPGHHLQTARAQEQEGLPSFRRFADFTAYSEGWALYAETLGEEMGLYTDPYMRFGQLVTEMWRAVRMVIDTGIHALRWDRQKALEYYKQNAPRPEAEILEEIDRCLADPGQVLAYKMGQLKIQELRIRAQKVLGERFDVRDFHEAILQSGAVPLTLLERNVEAYMRAKR